MQISIRLQSLSKHTLFAVCVQKPQYLHCMTSTLGGCLQIVTCMLLSMSAGVSTIGAMGPAAGILHTWKTGAVTQYFPVPLTVRCAGGVMMTLGAVLAGRRLMPLTGARTRTCPRSRMLTPSTIHHNTLLGPTSFFVFCTSSCICCAHPSTNKVSKLLHEHHQLTRPVCGTVCCARRARRVSLLRPFGGKDGIFQQLPQDVVWAGMVHSKQAAGSQILAIVEH